MALYYRDGYMVSAKTAVAWDRQQEQNRQREYSEAEQREQTSLLRQIAEQTKPKSE